MKDELQTTLREDVMWLLEAESFMKDWLQFEKSGNLSSAVKVKDLLPF
jgi:hypothetical protein